MTADAVPLADGDFLARLSAIVGERHVITHATDVAGYLTDYRGRYHGCALAVVRPGDAAEVAAIVRACAGCGVAIVPQGGNTGLCGGATPSTGGQSVLLSLTRLNRLRALDVASDTICVEAGRTLAAIGQDAAAVARLFPLSLASGSTAQVGGAISTNAGGVHVLRYGNMRELTLGLEVVLPDGRLWDGLRGLRKDNTGYDLKHLLIGAEGTLGIVTAAVLKLFPLPRHRVVAWIAVPNPSAGVRLLGRFSEVSGNRLTAFELMSQPLLELVLKHIPDSRDPLSAPAAWTVLVELSETGPDVSLVAQAEAILSAAMEAGDVTDAVLAATLSQAARLWALRESTNEAQRREGFSIKHDISVPIHRIPEFLARAETALRAWARDVRIVPYGHVGDGNLHYNLFLPSVASEAALDAATTEANRIVYELVAELDGSISAEHGIGQLKRQDLRRYSSGIEIELMEKIKRVFDPRGLMNPGKML